MRILLVSAKWLGDAVNTTGAVAAIQAAFPHAEFVVSVGAPGAGVFQGWPGVEVWTRPKSVRLGDQLSMVRALRDARFDMAVHLEASRTLVRLVRWAGVPRRLGVVKPGDLKLLDEATEQRPDEHEVRGPVPRILSLLGISHDGQPDLRLTIGELTVGDQRYGSLASERVVGFHLGASNERKRWDLDQAATLIRKLALQGVASALVGGPGDAGLVPNAPCHNLAGTLTVREMAATMRHFKAFVSGDSGPMHVAGAMGVPQVCLFGPTNPARYIPPGSRHAILRHCDCPFRDLENNDDCDGHCTRQIGWQEVADHLHDFVPRQA